MDDDSKVSSTSDEVRSEANMGPQKPRQFHVFKRRWYILIVLLILNCSNGMLWLTFAPVADQTAKFLGISLDKVNWLSLIYMVLAMPLTFGSTWMLDTYGLRLVLILGSWFNMSGSVLRLVGVVTGVPGDWRFPVVMCGQTLCAIAQPLVFFSPTKLAALWFPEHQRATANMIASMANPLGLLIANIISPLIVSKTDSLLWLMFTYAVPATIACFLATVGIRESVPPTPPSASAETSTSEPFLQGVKLLLRNKAYMVLLMCLGGGTAIFTCFSTLLEQILCVKGYPNDFAGLCGALFITFGIVGAAILGPYVDKTKKFTEAVKVNICLTSLCCTAFAVISQMQGQKVALGAVCSLFGMFGFSVYPVALELSVECSYPVGEATSSGLIFLSGQIQSLIYIIILQSLTKPLADSPISVCALGSDGNLSWMVPALVMAGLLSLCACCFVLLFRTEYRRLHAEAKTPNGIETTSVPAQFGSTPQLS